VSSCTCAGVYETDELGLDHLGLELPLEPPPLLLLPPLPDEYDVLEEYDEDEL
jgi:hypothetical protein